jgi:hypothetical protein
MAARSWEQFDYDLAHPKSKREKAYEMIIGKGIDGSVPLAQARKNVGLAVPANDNALAVRDAA